MITADVAIIGSGPGGGMAANRLAGTGLKVTIIEKEVLPRSKPCGGAMPSTVRELIDWDFTDHIEATPGRVRILLNYGMAAIHKLDHPMLMVNRRSFDAHLIEHALETGTGSVRLMDGLEVTGIEEQPDSVLVRCGSTFIRANYLVAADGAFSKSLGFLGLRRKTAIAGAIEAEVEVVPEVFEEHAQYATFNFGCIPDGVGYGWIFPKNGYLTCGIGSWRGKPRLQTVLTDLLERSFPRNSVLSVERKGHPLPLYAGKQQIATQRTCVVGDAASLVDPIMGEGIRFALLSGSIAADVIAQVSGVDTRRVHSDREHADESGDCLIYQGLVDEAIRNEFQKLRRFVLPLYLSQPELFYRKFFCEGHSYFNLSNALSSLTDSPV